MKSELQLKLESLRYLILRLERDIEFVHTKTMWVVGYSLTIPVIVASSFGGDQFSIVSLIFAILVLVAMFVTAVYGFKILKPIKYKYHSLQPDFIVKEGELEFLIRADRQTANELCAKHSEKLKDYKLLFWISTSISLLTVALYVVASMIK